MENAEVTKNAENAIYNINGVGIKLRSGPGTSFSAGGELRDDELVQNIKKTTEPYKGLLYVDNEGYRWVYVKVLSGENVGNKGYVPSGYLKGY